jgi:multidrug efflux pump
MKARPVMTDVDSDQSENGVETLVTIDRDSAARMGVTPRAIDNSLYNAFGQRQVATIYEDINQYAVIMEWEKAFAQGPEALNDVYVPSSNSGATSRETARRRARPVSTRPCATPRPARRWHLGHADDAAERHRQRQPERHPDLDQPPERGAGHHRVVQPGRTACHSANAQAAIKQAEADRSACPPACAAASQGSARSAIRNR